MFAPDRVPTRAQIADVLLKAEEGHDASANEAVELGSDRLEIVRAGLTFDLIGFDPSDAPPVPRFEHLFDVPASVNRSNVRALYLVAGPHIAAVRRSLPVVRAQAAIAARLADALDGVQAVVWTPADSATGASTFAKLVRGWLAGGPFPALGMAAFREESGGDLASIGLSYLTGQELRLSASLRRQRDDATRLAMRLVNFLVEAGRIDEKETVTGPDGEALRLVPSEDGRTVHVRGA